MKSFQKLSLVVVLALGASAAQATPITYTDAGLGSGVTGLYVDQTEISDVLIPLTGDASLLQLIDQGLISILDNKKCGFWSESCRTVPEPGALGLIGIGFVLAGLALRRTRQLRATSGNA